VCCYFWLGITVIGSGFHSHRLPLALANQIRSDMPSIQCRFLCYISCHTNHCLWHQRMWRAAPAPCMSRFEAAQPCSPKNVTARRGSWNGTTGAKATTSTWWLFTGAGECISRIPVILSWLSRPKHHLECRDAKMRSKASSCNIHHNMCNHNI
jgi:hypothetical protein